MWCSVQIVVVVLLHVWSITNLADRTVLYCTVDPRAWVACLATFRLLLRRLFDVVAREFWYM